MTKIEAIIRPSKFDVVKNTLGDVGVSGMSVSEIRGHGRQKGHTETYRGREYEIDLVPKLRIDMVVQDDRVEDIVDAILASAGTGEIGDGKIFIFKAEEVIRIRNHERGENAI